MRLRTGDTARRHLDAYILPRLDEFIATSGFESFCQQWLFREQPDAAVVGRWWGKLREETPTGTRSVDREADAVAIDGEGRVLALGSCKWTDGPHDDSERAKLERIARAICERGEDPVYYFSSRSGCTKALQGAAKGDPGRYRLVALEELFP